MTDYQTFLVLGGGRFPDGTLTHLSTQRLDASVALYKERKAFSITVLGGGSSTYLPNAIQYSTSGAEERARYLSAKGIPASRIFKIENGKDTIGEAIACRDHMPSLGFSRFILVTSELHIPRSRWLFQTILGPGFHIDFFGVPCQGILIEEEEKSYLEATQHYFKENPDCLDDTRDWHNRQAALYKVFKKIHDKFHPPGKASEAYCAVTPASL